MFAPARPSPTSSRSRPRCVVALTVTPALCYYLLRARPSHPRRARLAARRGLAQAPVRAPARAGRCGTRARSSPRRRRDARRSPLALVPFMGREFLPPFNEGTLNINATLPPGHLAGGVEPRRRADRADAARDARGRLDHAAHRPRRAGRARGRREHERARGRAPSRAAARTPRCMEEVREQPRPHARASTSRSASRSRTASTTCCRARARRSPSSSSGRTSATLRDEGRRDPGRRWRRSPASSTCSSSRRSACRRCRSTSTAGRRPPSGCAPRTWPRRSSAPSAGTSSRRCSRSSGRYDVVVRLDDAARQSVETIRRHADRHAERRPRPARPGRRGAARPGPEHDQPRERAAADHRAGQRRGPRPRQRDRATSGAADRARRHAAAGLLRPVRRPVRGAGAGGAADRVLLSAVAIAGIFVLLYLALRLRAPGRAGHGEPAARADRRRGHGASRRAARCRSPRSSASSRCSASPRATASC